MDTDREDSAAREDSRRDEDPTLVGLAASAPAVVSTSVSAGGHRGRHAVAAPATSWTQEPGLALAFGSVAFAVVGSLAVVLGWVALLLLIAVVQVFLARAWTDYLEIPGATLAAVGIVVVAAVADVGVVVARLVDDSERHSAELLQVAPALGVTFLVAVLVQLARRDGRSGTLAGLVATVSGGALAVGAVLWLPLAASPAGPSWVAVGFAVVAASGVLVGGTAWIRQASRSIGPALYLPLMLGLLAGPFYVVARIVAG